MDTADARSNAGGTAQDHYSALVRMVAEVSQDHAQLRTFIYEFARVKLRKDLYPRFVEGAWSEIEEEMRGLETAIERIELDFAQSALPPASRTALPHRFQEQSTHRLSVPRSDLQRTTTFGDDAIHARSLLLRSLADRASALPIVPNPNDRLANAFLGKHLRSTFWRNTQLFMAAAIGVAIYVTVDMPSAFSRLRFDWLDKSQLTASKEAEKAGNVAVGEKPPPAKSAEVLRPRATDFAVPTEYGAYAVVDGKLTELEQLPIKVPDPRVAISAAISLPSRTHLPTGQIQFIVFRRDLMNNAPDRVAVRVMAQVMRALTFDASGHAKTTNVEQSWVIRSNFYQMRVAPLGDNPEMIVIRADPVDFVFPAGRYTLVLKGVGYDFTVDGKVTDKAHCLERSDTSSAPIYSECPKL